MHMVTQFFPYLCGKRRGRSLSPFPPFTVRMLRSKSTSLTRSRSTSICRIPGTIEEFQRQTGGAGSDPEECSGLLLAQDCGEVGSFTRPESIDPLQRASHHLSHQEQQRVQGLILRGRRHLTVQGQHLQETPRRLLAWPRSRSPVPPTPSIAVPSRGRSPGCARHNDAPPWSFQRRPGYWTRI